MLRKVNFLILLRIIEETAILISNNDSQRISPVHITGEISQKYAFPLSLFLYVFASDATLVGDGVADGPEEVFAVEVD